MLKYTFFTFISIGKVVHPIKKLYDGACRVSISISLPNSHQPLLDGNQPVADVDHRFDVQPV